jgi:peptide/nickel transport system substrate-binding protein
MAIAPNSTNIVPLLTESYNMSADALTYTFQLRHNVTFSNGDPFNSYVVWYTIYRNAVMAQYGSGVVTVCQNTTGVTAAMLNEYTNATPPASLLQIMQNPTNAVVTPDAYTVVFHLTHPFAAFLATQTSPEHTMVDPVVVSANGGVVAGQTNSWMSLNAVGTGPFMVQQYQPNNEITLVRNPKYWGGVGNVEPTPRVDAIIIKYVPNALTRIEDVQRGTAQMALVDPSLVPQAVASGGIYVPNMGPFPTVDFIPLDTQKFPFNNQLIRQAVAHAINYTAVRKLYYGFENPWVGPNPSGVVGYDPNLQPYSYNLTLAKQLLAQAGYPDGKGIPPVTFYAATDSPPTPDVGVLVQSNLAQIGIQVKVIAEPYASILPLLSGSPKDATYPDMVPQSWDWLPDPWFFANAYMGPIAYGAQNVGWYNNTQVNALLIKADEAPNQTARAAIYQQIAQIIYTDSPDIWLGQHRNMYNSGVPIFSTTVGGYVLNPAFDGTDFSHLYLTT